MMIATLAIPGWLYYSLLAGADLASTKIAQRRGCSEGAPLVGQGFPRQAVMKGAGVVVFVTSEKLAGDHRKVKVGLRVGSGALVAGAVLHNLTVDCRATVK